MEKNPTVKKTDQSSGTVQKIPLYQPLLGLIGNTPIMQLPIASKATILGKLEYLNPGGSVKDRSALFMVEDAERKGLLRPGGTIVEASSGNQGIALAMIGAVKGYRVVIIVPSRVSKEKIATLKAYGAEVVVKPDSQSGEEDYHAFASRIAKDLPNVFMPNQYFNPANTQAHYESTGPEIWRQTNGTITHFVVGLGSCGTSMGVGRFLKEQNPDIKIIGVDAATSALSSLNPSPYQVEGLGVDNLDGLYNKNLVDEVVPMTDEQIFDHTRAMARRFGLLVGLSAGAVLGAVMARADSFQEGDVVVAILADSGRAYLSKAFNL